MEKYSNNKFMIDDDTYGCFLEKTNNVVQTLVRGFAKLFQLDVVVIKKIVALHHLVLGNKGIKQITTDYDIDLSKVVSLSEFERETAILVMQMWADSKLSIIDVWDESKLHADEFWPSSMKQAKCCLDWLGSEDKEKLPFMVQARKKDRMVFLALREWIAETMGFEWPEIDPGTPVVHYKPLESLFYEVYVRRGQTRAAAIVGDLRRSTFVVESQEQLDAIAVRWLGECKGR